MGEVNRCYSSLDRFLIFYYAKVQSNKEKTAFFFAVFSLLIETSEIESLYFLFLYRLVIIVSEFSVTFIKVFFRFGYPFIIEIQF